jgi:hypothetical protein
VIGPGKSTIVSPLPFRVLNKKKTLKFDARIKFIGIYKSEEDSKD